jgi:hypothetical protein
MRQYIKLALNCLALQVSYQEMNQDDKVWEALQRCPRPVFGGGFQIRISARLPTIPDWISFVFFFFSISRRMPRQIDHKRLLPNLRSPFTSTAKHSALNTSAVETASIHTIKSISNLLHMATSATIGVKRVQKSDYRIKHATESYREPDESSSLTQLLIV